MDSFRSGTKNSRMGEAQYRICIFCFLSAPNFAKTKRGANGKFLPKPLLFHLRLPNSKKISRVFCEILSPKNSFRKTSSALFRHLPETLRAEHQRKMSFPFQEKFHPRHIRKARNIFLWCCRVKRGSGGTIHWSSGLSAKYIRTLSNMHRLRHAEA